MSDIPDLPRDPGSYVDLRKRTAGAVHDDGIAGKVMELYRDSIDSFLAREKVVLSRPEKERLLQQIASAELKEVLSALKASK